MKNSIEKDILKGNFADAYRELLCRDYSFEFHELDRDFPKIQGGAMYLFLMYAVSQNEDAEKHLSICQYLYFGDKSFNGADSLIRWHLMQALRLSPDSRRVVRWIMSVYSGNPDCPFSEEEMEAFRQLL